jgi:hypothetical protein
MISLASAIASRLVVFGIFKPVRSIAMLGGQGAVAQLVELSPMYFCET